MSQARIAWAFLTRLPGGSHPDPSGSDGGLPLANSLGWFGPVGLIIGALGSAVYVGASEFLSPFAAATLALASTALATGGLHEDGLADSFDGLVGGFSPERRLEILKDSRLGTFGVLALVLVTLLKIAGLAELTGWFAVGSLLTAHVLGRAGAVLLLVLAPQARHSGLGASYSSNRTAALIGTVVGLAIAIAVAVATFGLLAPVIVGVGLSGVIVVGVWAMSKLGGITGDILGAAEQVVEVLVLLAAAIIAGT